MVGAYRMLAGSPDHVDEDWANATTRLSVERSPQDPTATQRHVSAGRRARFPPTEIAAGAVSRDQRRQDPIIRPAAGRAAAHAAPKGRFVSLAAMGHTLPPRLWP